MDFDLSEAIEYYKKEGAPKDQNAFKSLLKEIQMECDGISKSDICFISEKLEIKESFTLAFIKRIPSLRIKNTHTLEICSGVNCSKKENLNSFIKRNYGNIENLEIKNSQCMKMCTVGPNIRFDGKIYNKVTEKDIKNLLEKL